MVTFGDLPPEILNKIVRCMSDSELSSFSQVCKAARPFAEPILYHFIKWKFYDEDGETDPGDPLPNHPIHSHFRGIFRRPILASYVKDVQVTSVISVWSWRDGVPRTPPPPDVEPLWLDALGRLRLSGEQRAQFSTEIHDGNSGALVALLLSLLPELEVLTVDYTLVRESELMNILLQREGYLRNLEELNIRNYLDSRIIKFRSGPRFSSFFSHSKLKRLSTILQREDDISLDNLPALYELHITNHLSTSRAINTILTNTPKLESFSYFLVEDTDDLAEDEDYQSAHTDEWQAFTDALLRVAGSLQTLEISIDEAATSDYPPDTMDEDWMQGISARRGYIGSLRDLRCLTTLEIPLYLLLGHDPDVYRLPSVLPPSLKKLYLRDDHVYDIDLWSCDALTIVTFLEAYLLGHGSTERLALEEFGFILRSRGLTDRFDNDFIKELTQLKELKYLEQLESLARKAGVKCTMYLRTESCMSAEADVMDDGEELVIYDPAAIDAYGGENASLVKFNGHSKKHCSRPARCFLSNT